MLIDNYNERRAYDTLKDYFLVNFCEKCPLGNKIIKKLRKKVESPNTRQGLLIIIDRINIIKLTQTGVFLGMFSATRDRTGTLWESDNTNPRPMSRSSHKYT